MAGTKEGIAIMKTKKARGLILAKRNIEQRESYQKGDNSSSRLKEKIGCLLLCLLSGSAQADDWQQFGWLLRRFYRRWLRHTPESHQTHCFRGF